MTDGNVVGWKRVDELIEASLGDLGVAARATENGAAGTSKSRDRNPQFTVGGMGKLRILSEGNKEPITNIGIADASSSGTPTLFILTTSEILALPLPPSHGSSRHKATTPTVLDDLGAAVGCAKIMRLGLGRGIGEDGETAERMVVAREEAIYVYGSEGREGCWAYEGECFVRSPASISLSFPLIGAKSAIFAIQAMPISSASPSETPSRSLPTPYLAIVTPPQRSTIASQSATIRQHASRSNTGMNGSPRIGSPAVTQDEQVSKVTIFDPENKFVAFTAAFGDGGSSEGAGIRQIVEAWNAIWVLTDSGQVSSVSES